MEQLLIRNSRWKYVSLALSWTILLIPGIYYIVNANWLGWVLIGIFAFVTPYFIWKMFDSSPLVVIDRNGIFVKSLNVGVIQWKDIEKVTVSTDEGIFLRLGLKNPEKYVDGLPSAHRKTVQNGNYIWVKLTNSDIDTSEVLRVAQRNLESSRLN